MRPTNAQKCSDFSVITIAIDTKVHQLHWNYSCAVFVLCPVCSLNNEVSAFPILSWLVTSPVCSPFRVFIGDTIRNVCGTQQIKNLQVPLWNLPFIFDSFGKNHPYEPIETVSLQFLVS